MCAAATCEGKHNYAEWRDITCTIAWQRFRWVNAAAAWIGIRNVATQNRIEKTKTHNETCVLTTRQCSAVFVHLLLGNATEKKDVLSDPGCAADFFFSHLCLSISLLPWLLLLLLLCIFLNLSAEHNTTACVLATAAATCVFYWLAYISQGK